MRPAFLRVRVAVEKPDWKLRRVSAKAGAEHTPWSRRPARGSRAGAELLFQVFADRYVRASLLITSNLAFSDWGQVFQGERMTAALLDRLTHRCHIFEMNGESYRFRESVKARKETAKVPAAKKEK